MIALIFCSNIPSLEEVLHSRKCRTVLNIGKLPPWMCHVHSPTAGEGRIANFPTSQTLFCKCNVPTIPQDLSNTLSKVQPPQSDGSKIKLDFALLKICGGKTTGPLHQDTSLHRAGNCRVHASCIVSLPAGPNSSKIILPWSLGA